jgi:S-adenosylmethionine synthetase
MPGVLVEAVTGPTVEDGRIELVERKGRGHPDSICDAVGEEVSLALCREYMSAFGRILHHNIDKALLVAGQTQPRLGGGRVLRPMRLVLGDRATAEYKGKQIRVAELAEATARAWFGRNLRFVDPDQHVVIQNELQQGSVELADLFEREAVGANDTSAAVGYAPLTETERLVLAAEHFLNADAFKEQFPEVGEDIKVMGVRRDRELLLTIAVAFVDRFVPDARTYVARKEEVRRMLVEHLTRKMRTIDRVDVELNMLDDPARDEGGMYLTVLGTSAECGDSGQIGRGNRVNGVIALNRPMGTEAAAGKNPLSHVGKIYTVLTHQIASRVCSEVPGVREAFVWLCSQIGQPLDTPLLAAVQLKLEAGVALQDVHSAVVALVERELSTIPQFSRELVLGKHPVW